jgi:hypothetical protein
MRFTLPTDEELKNKQPQTQQSSEVRFTLPTEIKAQPVQKPVILPKIEQKKPLLNRIFDKVDIKQTDILKPMPVFQKIKDIVTGKKEPDNVDKFLAGVSMMTPDAIATLGSGVNEYNKVFYNGMRSLVGDKITPDYKKESAFVQKQVEGIRTKSEQELVKRVGEDGATALSTQMGRALGQGISQITMAAINPTLGATYLSAMIADAAKSAHDEAYEIQKDKGIPDQDAKRIANKMAIGVGILNGLETVPILRIFKLSKMAKPLMFDGKAVARRMITTGGLETLTEGIQSGGEAFLANYLYNAKRKPLDEALMSMLISLPTGGAFGVAGEVNIRLNIDRTKVAITEKLEESGLPKEEASSLASFLVNQQLEAESTVEKAPISVPELIEQDNKVEMVKPVVDAQEIIPDKKIVEEINISQPINERDAMPVKADDTTTSIKSAKASRQSFDDWVKGREFFTGRGNKIDDFSKTKSDNLFFTKNKEVAEYYGGTMENVSEGFFDTSEFIDLSSQAKKAQYVKSNFTKQDVDKLFPDIKDNLRNNRIGATGETLEEFYFRWLKDLQDEGFTGGEKQKILLDKLRQQGHKGVILEDATMGIEGDKNSYVVFDKSSLKTRSQLKAEWDGVAGDEVMSKREEVDQQSKVQKAPSLHYERIKEGLEATDTVERDVKNIREEANKAFNYINKNPEKSMRVALGFEAPPKDILKTAIQESLIETYRASNPELARQIARQASLAYTQSAQDLNMAKLSLDGNNNQRRIEGVISGIQLEKLGQKLAIANTKAGTPTTPLEAGKKEIKRRAKKANDDIMQDIIENTYDEKTGEKRKKTQAELADDLISMFDVC